MPNWNEQQRRAVEIRDHNVLVSASAGSGKTTVLVGRLMDLVLKDGISVDAILAMTFTEAAANEMKKRLSACRDAIRNGTKITEAYLMYGFKDYSGFYRAFKKEYGMSPREWQEISRKQFLEM